MNAPANIAMPSIDERAHRHTISVHCPGCSELEMAARCDLAALRDAATSGALRATDSAAVMLAEVSRLATHAVYAQVETSKLIRIRAALDLTVEAARALERVCRDG